MDPKKHPFYCTYSPRVAELLRELNCSLAISTYQAGKVIFISPHQDNSLIQLPRDFQKAMGLCVQGRRMAVACKDEVVVLSDSSGMAQHYPKNPGVYDRMYVPRATYYTGEVDIHDMHWGDDGLEAIITRFSCIAKIDDQYSITPIWKPKFITSLEPVDKCHLNGMATYNGKAKYASAFGISDKEKGWRENILKGGIIIDIESDEIIAEGLPMPHSPRIYDGNLYVLLSGTGELIEIDPETGHQETVTRLEGFVRGMCKWGDYLFIGLSRIRKESNTFRDLPIMNKDVNCGIDVIHLPTGMNVGNIRYVNDVQELYDIQILHNTQRPGILNTSGGEHLNSLNTPEKDFWTTE